MKYLKKFNEELKSQTYLSASRKLKQLGNPSSIKRSKILNDWSTKVEFKEYLVKWKQKIEEYSKYGVFRLNIRDNFSDDFYTALFFDSDAFLDEFEYPNQLGSSTQIYFSLGIIPKTKEVLDKCMHYMPLTNSGQDAFSNGFFWGLWVSIDVKIINGNRFEISDMRVSTYDRDDTGDVSLTSGAAQKLKNLLVQLLTNKELDYPSSATDTESEYENINNSFIKSGISSDYGLTLDDIAEYIKEYPKHKLMN